VTTDLVFLCAIRVR